MRVAVDTFRGTAPRIAPRALPDSMGQVAQNTRLLTGDLQAWRDWAVEYELSKTAPINTIYRMYSGYWLSWTDSELAEDAVCVDVARGPIPGDTTERTYLTGLDAPRYTNIALATTGMGTNYPIATRLLGVPAPIDTPVITVDLEDSSNDGTVSYADSGGHIDIYTKSSDISGSGSPPYDLFVGPANELDPMLDPNWYGLDCRIGGTTAFMHRDIGLELIAAATFVYTVRLDPGLHTSNPDTKLGMYFLCNAAGVGPAIRIANDPSNQFVRLYASESWASVLANEQQSLATTIAASTFYTVTVDTVSNGTGQATARVRIAATATPTSYFFDNTFIVTPNGSEYGVSVESSGTEGTAYVSYLAALAAGQVPTPTGDPVASAATNYVYTYVNSLGEEGAPSPVSATIVRPNGTVVLVSTEDDDYSGFPDGYDIVFKRVYRAVSGSTGASFQLVAEIPISQMVLVDTLTDAQLGETLGSTNYDLPPDDLRGILSLPNGIMAGFAGNQLCFSEPYKPHAWPVGYRLATDTDIVAIGAIDANVIVTTQSFPYVASGVTPSAYSMRKYEFPQGCISKRSLAYLKGVGVVYASPDGLIGIDAVGNVTNLTDTLFTRQDWQNIYPSTIIGNVHDDRYFGFILPPTSAADPSGFILELKQGGFGYVTLDFQGGPTFSDPSVDEFFALDLTGDGQHIYQFDAAVLPREYLWRSKQYLLPWENAFNLAQIKADDYLDITLRLYANGVLFFTKRVLSAQEFVVPPTMMRRLDFSLSGTSRIQTAQIVQEPTELT